VVNSVPEIEDSVKTIRIKRWEEFDGHLKQLGHTPSDKLLFRGHSSATWSLETTLERAGKHGMPLIDYYSLISSISSSVQSFTGKSWDVPEDDKVQELAADYDQLSRVLRRGKLPGYSYMSYLRHHGFPSPLLDWTQSPYVAAYFAFARPTDDDVAIFVYCEMPEGIKTRSGGKAQIRNLGPNVLTHRRHFLQQSAYTMCLQFENNRWCFAPHESVFAHGDNEQDALWKFTIPSTERHEVLRSLDAYNLNAFSLFDSEDALMETLSIRRIDLVE
jgi:hypothetical protein